ncbi:hypothetical protein BE17_12275 [Sorangium cellulosum]|uniref:DUF421 domain-containing protein n=1 Tax=Sorangium cellulosum TaxID=56 RepID=A0A150SKC2_SORCE|nr:hypothetical protein BE17_12275 [Sorangium cellulosum]
MFFSNWNSLGRIVLVGGLAYVALVVLLRVSGKRVLSKMNAFDLVITIALGSTLATVMLSKSVALVDGVLAFAVLISLQFLITWLSVRSKAVSRMVKAEPMLLVHRGEMLPGALKQERVVEAEILAAAREHGLMSLGEVEAMILETDGSFSVIRRSPSGGEAPSTP